MGDREFVGRRANIHAGIMENQVLDVDKFSCNHMLAAASKKCARSLKPSPAPPRRTTSSRRAS
jgi:hypothetical protein